MLKMRFTSSRVCEIFFATLCITLSGINSVAAAECIAMPMGGSNGGGLSTTNELPGVPYAYAYNGNEIFVNNSTELQSAISNAQPGDEIILSTGLFPVGHRVSLSANGTANQPIVIRAASTRNSEVRFSQSNGIVEGFVVQGKNWIVDGLVLSSDCNSGQHSRCEHAVHVKSGAEGFAIRNSQLVDFNAAIKGGGANNVFANNVRIEHNEIYNTSARQTANPVTPIDINGGDSWVIAKNHIYDFAKGFGNQISYAAFLKANSSNGLMDSNLVQCQRNVVAPGSRVGLSFGGGGNSPINSPICKNSDCSHLHRRGRITNNVIANCTDVGIYINASSDTLLDHNTLFSTTGIDVRFETSTARVVANTLVGGDISERNGGKVLQNEANSFASVASVSTLLDLTDVITPHSTVSQQVDVDICGYQRQTPFVGAIGGTTEERETCLASLRALMN